MRYKEPLQSNIQGFEKKRLEYVKHACLEARSLITSSPTQCQCIPLPREARCRRNLSCCLLVRKPTGLLLAHILSPTSLKPAVWHEVQLSLMCCFSRFVYKLGKSTHCRPSVPNAMSASILNFQKLFPSE